MPRPRLRTERWLVAGALGVLAGVLGCGARPGTIGAILAQRPDGTLSVRQAPQGLAAASSGVEVGDRILLIDGRDVRSLSATQVHQALSGDVGEPVKLTLERGETIVRVTLRRSPAREGLALR